MINSKRGFIIALLLLFVNITFSADAQVLKIDLKTAPTTSLMQIPARIYADTSVVIHMPFKQYSNRSLRRLAYYNLQAMYENLKDNPDAKKSFKEFIERYQIDTSYLTKQKIPGNYIYLCTALDDKGRKHVIIDANNNHDFRDDHDYVFELGGTAHPLPMVKASINYFDGSIVRKATVNLQIDAYNTMYDDSDYKSAIDKKLDVIVNTVLLNKTGSLTVDHQSFAVNVLNYDELHPRSPFDINIYKMPFDEKNNNSFINKRSDTLKIASNRYTVKAMNNNILYLRYVGKTTSNGAETGMIAPDIIATDIQTNTPFNLKANQGKYVLLDFWGSWCVPCIRLIPEVKRLHEKYRDEIQFVSIAYDKSIDQEKVQTLIRENDMNWIQLLDSRDKKNGIIEQYKVDEFPTSILISPAGKVIYRGTADKGLQKLIESFNLTTQKN
jgi:thiol-disulfide isomerase/thioredoxin